MASDIYVKLDGITGESTDDKHKDWIEISSFSHGLAQSTMGSPSESGSPSAGKVDLQNVMFTKQVDKATPKIAQYGCTGKHIPKVEIEFCEATEEQETYLKYELEDVLISSHSLSGGNGSRPTESVSLAFAQIKWEYIPVDHSGSKGAAVTSGWDLRKNKQVS